MAEKIKANGGASSSLPAAGSQSNDDGHGKSAEIKHSFSLYKMTGEPFSHPFCREDLFSVITGMERYVVDSSSDWKSESQKQQNANKAFIIGRTVLDEAENPLGVFHSKKVDVSNNNIFSFYLDDALNSQTLVWIDRVDKAYFTVVDRQKLVEEKKPLADRTDEKSVQWRKRTLAGIDHTKRRILDILDVGNIAELTPSAELSALESRLTEYIQANSQYCFRHWVNSAMVAECCYALLLIRHRNIRNEFAEPDYLNVLGDTMLVHNALFFRAKILSKDFAPKKMASYVGDSEIVAASKIS